MAMTPDEAGYVQALEAKVLELEAEIAKLEVEMKRLRQEKGLPSGIRDGLTFNEHTGLYSDQQSGQRYCSTCLAEEKRHPMESELPRGWRCSVQPKHYFSNPDDQPPVLNMRGGGGPQGWMR